MLCVPQTQRLQILLSPFRFAWGLSKVLLWLCVLAVPLFSFYLLRTKEYEKIGYAMLGCAIVALACWAYFNDQKENELIRQGDAGAIQRRIDHLMKEHRYSQEDAQRAVDALRLRSR
jgi:hypothetical protein